MKRRRRSVKRQSPSQGLRARLDEAEATLDAIRSGRVDALVVSGAGGERTLAIEGATHPYHILLNAMSDGAALLARDGTILFANRRLGEITRASPEVLRGSRFQQLVVPAQRGSLGELLGQGATRNAAREFAVGEEGSPTPVWVALSGVPLGTQAGGNGEPQGAIVVMAIITDLTERKQAEVTRLGWLRHLISAEDEERRRIARELHDETGQSLTALMIGLRVIEDQTVRAEVQSTARRLREVAAETVDNVGRLARGLHPSILDDLGLTAAARRYASDFAKSVGVLMNIQLDDVGPDHMTPLVQPTLYRILQESLTNVARHAQARTVGVELKLDGNMIELVVRDDGVGFDAAAARRHASGLGLHGIQERVALLGGSVDIESRPGEGTTVRARLPGTTVPPPPPDKPGTGRRRRSG